MKSYSTRLSTLARLIELEVREERGSFPLEDT